MSGIGEDRFKPRYCPECKGIIREGKYVHAPLGVPCVYCGHVLTSANVLVLRNGKLEVSDPKYAAYLAKLQRLNEMANAHHLAASWLVAQRQLATPEQWKERRAELHRRAEEIARFVDAQ